MYDPAATWVTLDNANLVGWVTQSHPEVLEVPLPISPSLLSPQV